MASQCFVTLFSFWLAVSFILTCTSALAKKPHCGIALSTGYETWRYRQPITDAVIRQIRYRDGGNYVQVSAYLTQIGTSPPARRVRKETDDESLRVIIRKARRVGLKVFLKPVIVVTSLKGTYIWRGYIRGTDEWFRSVHTPWILRMAKLAQEERVDIFSVGSEYVGTLSNTNAWLRTIKMVRAVYKGKLTYIANHDSYFKVKFYPALDILSISAYFRLRSTRRGPYPNLALTRLLYEREARKIDIWRRRSGLAGKKVLIAEFGIQSKTNGVAYFEPWEWRSKAPLDFAVQVKMYEAFFQAFFTKPWISGIMIWHYELFANAGTFGPSLRGYTPQRKPAIVVLRKYFKTYCQKP